MNYVSGVTAEEKRLVKSIQTAVGAYADNSIGQVTLVDIAAAVGADCFPLAVNLYDQPCIVCKDVIPAAVNAPLSNFGNALSGSFSYNQKPCSILITSGKVVYDSACHAFNGAKPESVLYRLNTGTVGIARVKHVSELPNGIKWAVGGLCLLNNYDPAAEGFVGAYSDVLRKTNHTAVCYKRGLFYLCYLKNKTAQDVNAWAKKMNMEHAVMLDGGHVAALNSTANKINTAQRQFYILQGV